MRAARDAGCYVRHARGRCAMRRVCGIVCAALAMPIASAAASQSATITSVAVLKSSWMAMIVAVTYEHPASDTLTLALQWRRLNGRPLRFASAAARLAPGSGQVALTTSYHGMLPPPTPMVLHLSLAVPNGKVVLARDCEMALVTPAGKDAWAGDLMSRRAGTLSWRVRSCH